MEHVGEIEKRLWSVADHLRANSNFASNEYFLPHAFSRFLRVKDEYEDGGISGGHMDRPDLKHLITDSLSLDRWTT